MLRTTWLLTTAAVLGCSQMFGQAVISAKSGVVQYIEGEVTIDGEEVTLKVSEFPSIQPNQVLAAKEGRAEVLLTPGVFLRLAEESSVRMISNALSDTRLEVLSGSVLVEVGELLEGNRVSFMAGQSQIDLPKEGLYRIDGSPARLRVYDGRAIATSPNQSAPITAKKGQDVDLGAVLATTKFDTKQTDAFYRWSARRTSYVAAANMTSARVASRTGYGSSFSGRSAWSWNPYFGMFTFVPARGVYWSAFGTPFYSPGAFSSGMFGPGMGGFGYSGYPGWGYRVGYRGGGGRAIAAPSVPMGGGSPRMGGGFGGGPRGGFRGGPGGGGGFGGGPRGGGGGGGTRGGRAN